MENWFFVIGLLVVIGVGLDLIRRTRTASRDSFEMDLNMQRGLGKEDPLSQNPAKGLAGDQQETIKGDANFPGGGARKLVRGEETQKISKQASGGSAPSIKETVKKEPRVSVDAGMGDTQKIRRTPTIGTATHSEEGEDQPVPMLMEIGDRQEALFSDDDPFMSGNTPILSRPRVVPRKNKQPADNLVQEVIVINVMSKEPGGLNGAKLLETVLSSGLRFGEMNIFHYHISDDDDTALFSMANILKPGTFDLNNMQSFQTPGISLFMSLPLKDEKVSAMETFDKLLGCAKKIAQNLNGELRDEKRSVMTGQTIEHCRQRISEFARKTLSRSGKYSAT